MPRPSSKNHNSHPKKEPPCREMQRKLSGPSAGKRAKGALGEGGPADFQTFACQVCTRTRQFTTSMPSDALKAQAVSYNDGRSVSCPFGTRHLFNSDVWCKPDQACRNPRPFLRTGGCQLAWGSAGAGTGARTSRNRARTSEMRKGFCKKEGSPWAGASGARSVKAPVM